MDGTETRQRRPEELGLLHGLSTGRLPEASEDGPLSVPESQRVAPKPLGPELSRETTLSIGLQVTVPFLFAGLGLSGAGILLNYFQHWPVFTEVKDLLTLVPPLVGLKGNLEMTLASRLSTAANTGQIDGPREQHRVISSNLALIQVQAAVVGLLAAVAALLLGAASGQELDAVEAEVLCASSVITAFLAACALGMLMVCIVIGARKLGVNPDNIATPIAASLGDLITLSILAFVSSFFHKHRAAPRGRHSSRRTHTSCPRGDSREECHSQGGRSQAPQKVACDVVSHRRGVCTRSGNKTLWPPPPRPPTSPRSAWGHSLAHTLDAVDTRQRLAGGSLTALARLSTRSKCPVCGLPPGVAPPGWLHACPDLADVSSKCGHGFHGWSGQQRSLNVGHGGPVGPRGLRNCRLLHVGNRSGPGNAPSEGGMAPRAPAIQERPAATGRDGLGRCWKFTKWR
ncbi:solute carrier family 41 member 3 isoform X3 [Monodon monoceros]|uniref:solute carrier family 41 member 3 isoform X3 n=1 Tax=Monodon monoceros TaxID=40151 RepID=UPI0010F575A2|nr:solute carrier family 41 member 3 isoform X3 [Monodon monoceros]XP_029098510.1 solute carrier family 41 member 3 isoform X3 [Monodon monoceros]